jgi:hypothetical protein
MKCCLGCFSASPPSQGPVKVASGGLELQDGYASRAHRRRARERTGKRERKRRYLGGREEWCEFDGMLGGGFYRPERVGKEVAEGGGPGGIRGSNGWHDGFGSVLACAASSYGAVMHVQACWRW